MGPTPQIHMRHGIERAEPGAVETTEEESVVSRILREGVFEHDERQPNRFRIVLAYGRKLLDCSVRKREKVAGATIENVADETFRRPHETTLLYKALRQALVGVANRVGEPIRYTLVTTNEKLIEWAKNAGSDIFQWQNVRTDEDLVSFECEIRPSVTTRSASVRSSVAPGGRTLVWEARTEFKQAPVTPRAA